MEGHGDILIRGIWAQHGTDFIINIRIMDVDANSRCSKAPDIVLTALRQKNKYLEACLRHRQHFSPFVVSMDGLFCKEVETLLKKLSALLAEKWEKPYSEVCGYINAQMSIAIVRATHLCIRRSQIPTSKMSKRLPQREDKTRLSHFRH
jgi:hypothetical protein